MSGRSGDERIRGRLWPWLAWMAAFYAVWACVVSVGGWWPTVAEHWAIAAAMAAGSYFAGSTPMGGGSVGFPVLVLLFDQPATLGRNFGLAVQSIGMVSAAIFIFCARRPVDWHLLRPALLGALIGTPIGAAFVAPVAPDLWVKLLFAVIWASFGVMHFAKLRSLIAATGQAEPWHGVDRPLGVAIGLSGGVVASLTGVGIDMMLYAVLVLLYRADLKVAIPTSVILMAFTSVVGIATNLALSQVNPAAYAIVPAVLHNWLAAAPVVALGAPLGVMIVQYLPRAPTLIIVSTLCVGQFLWTLVNEQVTGWPLVAAFGGVLGMNAVFHFMYQHSGRRLGKREQMPEAEPPAAASLSAAESREG